MLARNWDLCRLAISSWRPLSSISWNSRAFSMATAAWEAKIWSNAAVWAGTGSRPTLLSAVRSPTTRPRAIMGTTRNALLRSPRRSE